MDAELLTESKMMVAREFGIDGIPKEPTVTIASVGRETQKPAAKGKKGERWGIVHFKEEWAKPYKFNGTNKRALITMFGKETDNWIGKRITLFAKPGTYFGEVGVAVRVKGSPDISEVKSFSVKRFGSREEDVYNLVPTGGAKPAPAKPAPAAAPTPSPEPKPLDAEQRKAAGSSEGAAALEAQRGLAAANSAPAPASAPVAARAATPPGGVPFGPYKTGAGGAARLIAELDDPELLETVTFGEQKIAAEPNATWVKSVSGALVALRAELERRYNERMKAEDEKEKAAAAGGSPAPAPREPGSDDAETTEPPF